MELSRGNLKQKHWKEVADIVSSREDYGKTPKTDIQCKNRIDTVKKKYKVEKSKIAGGGGPSKWPFFERLDQLIGPTAKIASGTSTTPNHLLTSGAPHKVPVGIPVGVRSVHEFKQHQQNQQQQKLKQKQQNQKQKQKQAFRKQAPVDSDSSRSEPDPPSPDSTDSFPPEPYRPKRPRVQRDMNSNANAMVVRPVMMNQGTDRKSVV